MGFGTVVSGSARNQYWLYFFRMMAGRVKFSALAVGLVTDVVPQSDPPNFAFAKIEPRVLVRGVSCFLDFVPAVKVFLHTHVCRA